MEWYCALVGHLVDTANNAPVQKSFNEVMSVLKRLVIELYKAILLYQMRSACSYYRNQGYNFFAQLGDFDNWAGLLRNVVKASEELMIKWAVYSEAKANFVRDQIADTTDKMKTQLESIHQTLEEYIKQQNERIIDEDSQACLSHLFVVNPLDDMTRIEKRKEPLIEDALSWLLESKEFKSLTNWDDPTGRLLWIKGNAGTGKTMLSMGIVRALSATLARLSPSITYFFFQSMVKLQTSASFERQPTSEDFSETTPTALDSVSVALKTLMWMLLKQQPDLIWRVVAESKSTGGNFSNMNTPYMILRLFKAMLPDTKPVHCVIDALDECEKNIDGMIELIAISLCVSDNVRWIVTSRPEVNLITKVRRKVEDLRYDLMKAGTLLDVVMDIRRDGFDAYLHQKWSRRKRWTYGDTFDNTIMTKVSDIIRKRARGNMLWAFMVFEDLSEMQGDEAEEVVEQYPNGLVELYNHKLKMIESQPDYRNDNLDHWECCKDVLILISYTYRPLSLSECKAIIPWRVFTNLERIIRDCSPFISLKVGIVAINHKSARDYLMDRDIRPRLGGGNVRSHEDIGRLSLKALTTGLKKKNIYDLKHYGPITKNVTPPKNDPLVALAYCCEFWALHFCLEEDGSLRQLTLGIDDILVLNFSREKFLYWLESLALLRVSEAAVETVELLLYCLQVCF